MAEQIEDGLWRQLETKGELIYFFTLPFLVQAFLIINIQHMRLIIYAGTHATLVDVTINKITFSCWKT